MEPEIIVRGRGEASAMPDRALIHCTIETEGASRESVYDDAAESSRRVDDVLSSHQEGLGRVTTAALVVHPRTRWKKGESTRTGWRASRVSMVEVVGFDHLGGLIAELVDAGGSISGPSWELDASNAVHSEVRRLAAEDARRRADDYATALRVELGSIAWVSEPGLRGSTDGGHPMAMFASARSHAGAGPEEIIEVTPEEITAEASVDVSFRIRDMPLSEP